MRHTDQKPTIRAFDRACNICSKYQSFNDEVFKYGREDMGLYMLDYPKCQRQERSRGWAHYLCPSLHQAVELSDEMKSELADIKASIEIWQHSCSTDYIPLNKRMLFAHSKYPPQLYKVQVSKITGEHNNNYNRLDYSELKALEDRLESKNLLAKETDAKNRALFRGYCYIDAKDPTQLERYGRLWDREPWRRQERSLSLGEQ